jgi:hypothetical protein
MGFKKSNTLLQPLYVVHHSQPGIARAAHPAAKCPDLMTVIEVEREHL